MSHRLLMLGLDGLGADVLGQLAVEGLMPNLARLMSTGAVGPLRATEPPITGPSWLCVATGLDVDQTGIADFLVRRPPLFGLRPIGSREFRGRSIWDFAAAAGLRTCVFNFPILFPPYDANGVMVSGFGTDESTQWTSPASLKAELVAVAGRDYNLAVNYHAEQYDDLTMFLDDLEASIDRRLLAAEWLLRREPWDLAVCMFSETDWLMHRCWHILDASDSDADSDASRSVGRRARAVFSRIDAAVPRLLEAMGDASVLICSDHGFGSNTGTFKINAALERAGLLVRRTPTRRGSASMRQAGVRFAQRAGAAAARVQGPLGRSLARVRRRARRLLPKDDSAYLADVIDPEASLALDPGHTIPFGGIYVGQGIARESDDYRTALDRIEAQVSDQAERAGAAALTFRRPWLDAPTHPETLPDLVVSGDAWGMTFSKTEFDGPLLVPGPFSRRHTGSHRIDGVYLAAGPLFESSVAHESASVLDIAPTILACVGLAAPSGCRGTILPSFRGSTEGLAATMASTVDAPDPSADDDGDVRERLRGLGYIE